MDILLFIEIILSEGAQLLDTFVSDDVTIEWYQGPNGRRVPIIVSDELMTRATAHALLRDLGYHDLIERLG